MTVPLNRLPLSSGVKHCIEEVLAAGGFFYPPEMAEDLKQGLEDGSLVQLAPDSYALTEAGAKSLREYLARGMLGS